MYANQRRMQAKIQKARERSEGYYVNTRNGINFDRQTKSRGQVRREGKKRREFGAEMKIKSSRIKNCIRRREENKQENLELLTTRQEEVKAELRARGLDYNGNPIEIDKPVEPIEHPEPKKDITYSYTPGKGWIEYPAVVLPEPMLNTNPIEYNGKILGELNKLKHEKKELVKDIKTEGQAIKRIVESLEHTPIEYYHHEATQYPPQREDFITHKPYPPTCPISFHPELQGPPRGMESLKFMGTNICRNEHQRAEADLKFQQYIFYQECKMNPNIIWRE